MRALSALVMALVASWAMAQVATPAGPQNPKVTNVFSNQDLRIILSEVAASTGAVILADTSVKGDDVSIELKNDTVESALDKLSFISGLIWKKKDGMYLVSTLAPDAPMFSEFAITKVYVPKTQPAETLFALLTRNYTVYAQLDKSANLIVITAPEKVLGKVWQALEVADGPRRQFVLEALITEIKEGEDKETGFSWNWRHFAQGAEEGMSYAKASSVDILRLKSMIATNKATLRANPSIIAMEGREATLTVGTETYLALASGNSNFSSVQFQKVNAGITLKLTGFVDPSGVLTLHLQPEVSDVAAPVNGNPSTTVRRVDTYLRIEPGQTYALAGLIQESESNLDQKVPVLGDLPLVGSLFKSSRKQKRRTEVVILISPRLLDQVQK